MMDITADNSEEKKFLKRDDINSNSTMTYGTAASAAISQDGIKVGGVFRHVIVMGIGFLQFGKSTR